VAKDLSGKTLEELTYQFAAGAEGSLTHMQALAEFTRRQTQAQIEAAEYTKRNAKYMLWSVLASTGATIAAFITIAITLFAASK
jgi:hypothetical protein